MIGLRVNLFHVKDAVLFSARLGGDTLPLIDIVSSESAFLDDEFSELSFSSVCSLIASEVC
jgi:hypothetical protein